MSRGYAQILTSIWSDKDFVSLSACAQRHYFVLVSQPDINYAGVLALTERRWALCCVKINLNDVQGATEELSARRYVVVDYDTEELLVRSFVRNNGLWKQPKMLAIAVREALATASAGLREALADEFGRVRELIPIRDPVDGRIAMVDEAISCLMGGPAPTPPQGLDRASAGVGAGPREGSRDRAGAIPVPVPSTNTNPPRCAAKNATQVRARIEEPREPAIPERPPGPGVTGPSAADAYRLVDAAIGREHPHAVRTALAIQCGQLLLSGTERELLFAALTLWLNKAHLGPGALPNLVSEALRNRTRPAGRSRPSTTDQRVADMQSLKGHFPENGIPNLRALPGGAQ